MIRALSHVMAVEPVILEQSDDVLSTSQGLLLMGAIFAVVGLVVIYTSTSDGISRARELLGLDPVSKEVIDSGDPVDVAGTITATDGTVTGPLTDDECVLYEDLEQERRRDYKYDLDERREMRRSNLKNYDEDEIERKVTEWVTTDSDRSSVPFAVETQAGPVSVDVEDAELDVPTQHVEKASIIHRVLHSVPIVSGIGRLISSVNPTRRIERHLSPGDSVHVLGVAVESTDDGLVATEVPEGGQMVVTTKSARRHALGRIAWSLFASIPGVLITTLGLVLIAGGVYTAI